MKPKIFLTALFAFFALIGYSQNICITDDENYPVHPKAMLDIYSESKGLLIPRIELIDNHNPINDTKPVGLLIWNTATSGIYPVPGFYYWNSSVWIRLSDSQNLWQSTGSNLYYLNGNVGIGTSTPTSKLEVKADPNTPSNDALFVVKNQQGDSVFAVFENAAVIYINEQKAGSKYVGAIVKKKNENKDNDVEYFRVTPDSTRIYTANPEKGFSVTDLSSTTKEKYQNLNIYNSLIGLNAGKRLIINVQTTGGINNVFLGNKSGMNSVSGSGNVYIGFESGNLSTTGANNVFVGTSAGRTNNGEGNVFLGWNSGFANNNNNNVFIGASAGQNNLGKGNIFIGDHSGFDLQGDTNVVIGDNLEFATQPTYRNKLVISSPKLAEPFILGDFSLNKINMANAFIGDVGFGSSVVAFSHRNTANTIGFAMVQSSDGTKTAFNRVASPSGYFAFRVNGSNSVVYINDNGDFAIGSNLVPTQKLDVDGNARFRNVPSGVGNSLSISSDGVLVTLVSDIRLKDQISDISNCLDKVLQLQPKSYVFKLDNFGTKKIGFIAQDMEKVFPEFVFTNQADGYKGINYAEITAVLTQAIKEQQTQINTLMQKIEQLQNQIIELKK